MKIDTDKYHTILIEKTYLLDLTNRNITLAYLLSYYFTACNKYRTEIDLKNYLDEFYGVKYDASVSTIGRNILFTFSMQYADPIYVNDKEFTNQVMEEVFATIQEPLMTENGFDTQKFEKSKLVYEEELQEFRDDEYDSECKLIHTYFKDTVRDYLRYGDLEILKFITKEELYEFYQKMIKAEHIEYQVGNVGNLKDSEDTLKAPEYFRFDERGILEGNEIIENHQSEAAYLRIVIDPKVFAGDEMYTAIEFFNYFFGQSSYSTLFKYVREKENLCYSISSSYYGATGMIVISSMIDKNDYQKVLESIRNATSHVLDDFNLEEAKTKYLAQTRPNMDFNTSLISKRFYDEFYPFLSREDTEENIEKLTMEDLRNASHYFEDYALIYLYGGDK